MKGETTKGNVDEGFSMAEGRGKRDDVEGSVVVAH